MTKKNVPAQRPRPHVIISQRKRRAFLKVLAQNGGKVHDAALAAGYRDSTALRTYRKRDPEFAEAWDLAMESAGDLLEAEAVRRGVEGVREPIYYRGEIVGFKLVYSDALLQTLLKGARPDKYARDSQTQINVNTRVGIAVIPATVKDESEWERATDMAHKAQKPIDLESDEYEVVEPDKDSNDLSDIQLLR